MTSSPVVPSPTVAVIIDRLLNHDWAHSKDPLTTSAHNTHNYDGRCAVCRGDLAQIVTLIGQTAALTLNTPDAVPLPEEPDNRTGHVHELALHEAIANVHDRLQAATPNTNLAVCPDYDTGWHTATDHAISMLRVLLDPHLTDLLRERCRTAFIAGVRAEKGHKPSTFDEWYDDEQDRQPSR